jgi:hypothetical protein
MDAQTQKRLCNDGFLTLSFAEQFLVWGARVWLAATAQGARVPTVLQEGLCAAGVPEAWEPLNGLLRILCRNMRRTPDFHGVRCLCLGRDERALVAAVSAATPSAYGTRSEPCCRLVRCRAPPHGSRNWGTCSCAPACASTARTAGRRSRGRPGRRHRITSPPRAASIEPGRRRRPPALTGGAGWRTMGRSRGAPPGG